MWNSSSKQKFWIWHLKGPTEGTSTKGTCTEGTSTEEHADCYPRDGKQFKTSYNAENQWATFCIMQTDNHMWPPRQTCDHFFRFVLAKREICSQRGRFACDLNLCHSLLKKCKKLTHLIRRSPLLKHVISNKLLINVDKKGTYFS